MPSITHESDGDRADILDQTEAETRFSQVVGSPQYELNFNVVGGSESFNGKTVISFNYKAGSPSALFLDFVGDRIDVFTLNGHDLTTGASPFRGHRLFLDPAYLSTESPNVVVIEYHTKFSTSGNGLHRFVDPEDKQEYLYTQAEPFAAHTYFPCFDQPDIKGTFAISFRAPADWEVVSNYPLKQKTTDAGYTNWTFDPTVAISTYLVALVAGDYTVFHDSYDNGRIPLSWYCRKSLASVLTPQMNELFTVTKQGFGFYEKFFAYKYPFPKYSQAFVAEFNMGAMENVGIVTYSEHYSFRDVATDRERAERADTILHEMAHMWFGDLVTMKWWNGLWLNESFATFMAALSVYEATEFKQSWQLFEDGMKGWAYRTDQLSTTHPIEAAIPDTDATFLNFDGISYGKGASVLKQLAARVGMENFKQGMQKYFQTYAFGNTTLSQFLECVSSNVKIDIWSWSKQWLEEAGLNTLQVNYEHADGHVKRVEIVQTAPEGHPTLRSHQAQIACYDLNEYDIPVITRVISVLIEGPTTHLAALDGEDAPSCIFPNHADDVYAKFVFDPTSLQFVKQYLSRFQDSLTRQVLWRSLWNMTRDANGLKSTEYLDLVLAHVPAEKDVSLLAGILGNARAAVTKFMPTEEARISYGTKLFQFAYDLLANATGDYLLQLTRAVVNFSVLPEQVLLTLDLLDGIMKGVTLDQGLRWTVLQSAVAFGIEGAWDRVQAERERDPSDRGLREYETARVAVPSAEVKAAVWKELCSETDKSLHLYSATVDGFIWRCQRQLLEPYVALFFQNVHKAFELNIRDREFGIKFFSGLFPLSPTDPHDDSILDAAKTLFNNTPDQPSNQVLRRYCAEMIDNLTLTKKVRLFAL